MTPNMPSSPFFGNLSAILFLLVDMCVDNIGESIAKIINPFQPVLEIPWCHCVMLVHVVNKYFGVPKDLEFVYVKFSKEPEKSPKC